MGANQRFTVNVHIDASAARRALRNLEQEFKDMHIDFGDLNRAQADFRDLSKSIERLAKSFKIIDTSMRSFDRRSDRNQLAVRRLADAMEKLDRETAQARPGIRDLSQSLDRLGRGLNSAVNAIQRYARTANELEKGSPRQVTHLTRDLRQLDKALRETDFPLSEFSDDLRAVARSVSALDRAFDKVRPNQILRDFDQLAKGITRLRAAIVGADGRTESWIRELRDLADAIRAVERAERSMNRATRGTPRGGVGPGGRQAGRSGGVPVGFAGFGGNLGFLGIGGAGFRFAGAAAGIALFASLGQAIASAGRFLGEFIGQTASLGAQFDLLIRRANILAGGGALTELTRIALSEGKRTIFTATEAAEALGELARAGFDTRESIAALPAVLDLAAVDSLALADATLIVARNTRGFGLAATEAARVADILARTSISSAVSTTEIANALKFVGPAATQLRIPIEEVAAAVGVLGDQGQVAGLAGRALRFAFGALTSPTAVQAAAFERLNVKTTDVDGNFRGLFDITQQLAAAQQEAGSQAEFVGNVFDAFGKNAAPRILALINSVDEFGVRINENFNAFGTAARVANEQLAGLEGAFERLRGEFEGLQIELFDRTGFETALSSIVGEVEAALPTLFENLVDPLFSELAVGINRISNETLPQLVDATVPVGEAMSGILGNVFAFFTDNDDDIIASALGVVTAIQGVVDVFLGLGEVALPIIGAISASFSALPDAISSALTGATAGGLIGALFGPAGIVVGAGIGGILGVIGQQFSEATVPQQVAEFGTELGQALSTNIAQGLDIGQAINQSIAETKVPEGFFQATSISALLGEQDRIGGLLSELVPLQKQLDSLGGTARDDSDLAFFDNLRAAFKELGVESDADSIRQFTLDAREALADLGDQAEFTQGQVNAAIELNKPVIDQSIADAREFVARLARVGDPLQFAFEIETDPEAILRGLADGIDDFPALLRNGVAVPLDETGAILQTSADRFAENVEISIGRAIQEVDQQTLDMIVSLEGFRDAVAAVDFGTLFFTEVPDFTEQLSGLLQFDWEHIFSPTDDEGEEIKMSARQVERDLLEAIESIDGKKIRAGLEETVSGILGDDDLTLAEKAMAGAFVVDQAMVAEEAENYAKTLQSIFDRAQEIVDEAARTEATRLGLVRPDGGLSTSVDRIEQSLANNPAIQRAREASTALTDLVGAGQVALAQVASVSDDVLGAVLDNMTRIEDAEGLLNELELEIQQEIDFIASSDSIQTLRTTVTTQVTELAEEVGEIDVISGLEDQFGVKLPQVVTQGAIDALAGFKEEWQSKSPSRKFIEEGLNATQGLQIGWDQGFGAFRSNVLGDVAALIAAIRSAFANLTFSPIKAPTITGIRVPDRLTFHSGGLIPGSGEQDIRALGGEFVLRRQTVAALNAMGVNLTALNRDPRSYPDPIARDYLPSRAPSYDYSQRTESHHEHTWNLPATTTLDEKKIAREFEKKVVRKVRL